MNGAEPFAAYGGRKFILTVGGIVTVTCLSLFGTNAPDAAMQAIGAMVLVFNGANAAVTWGAMRTTTKDETPALPAGYVRYPDVPEQP